MHVVIAINEPKFAEAIANFVINHEWNEDTSFTVISIVKPVKVASFQAVLPGPILDELMEKKMIAANQLVDNFIKSIAVKTDPSRIKKVVREGFPTDEIMDELNSTEADLLVVGSHARHGLERTFLGSVSHSLVFQARCSVIVIRLPVQK